MANEHVLVYELELPISVTVADATALEKGALVKFADPNTVSGASADDYIFGITAREKVANDGQTQIAVYRKGIFKATLGGSVTAGQSLAASGSNIIKVSTASHVGAKTMGTALETGANTETILYELNPGVNNTAYA